MTLYLRINDKKEQHTKMDWSNKSFKKDEKVTPISFKLFTKFLYNNSKKTESMEVIIRCCNNHIVTFNDFVVMGLDDKYKDTTPFPYFVRETTLGELRCLVDELLKKDKTATPYKKKRFPFIQHRQLCILECDNDEENTTISIEGLGNQSISVYKDDIDKLIDALEQAKNFI